MDRTRSGNDIITLYYLITKWELKKEKKTCPAMIVDFPPPNNDLVGNFIRVEQHLARNNIHFPFKKFT
jgi:hypothetical protein